MYDNARRRRCGGKHTVEKVTGKYGFQCGGKHRKMFLVLLKRNFFLPAASGEDTEGPVSNKQRLETSLVMFKGVIKLANNLVGAGLRKEMLMKLLI